jgi:hypothetical protein
MENVAPPFWADGEDSYRSAAPTTLSPQAWQTVIEVVTASAEARARAQATTADNITAATTSTSHEEPRPALRVSAEEAALQRMQERAQIVLDQTEAGAYTRSLHSST